MEHQRLVGHYAPNPVPHTHTIGSKQDRPREVVFEDNPELSSERESLHERVEKQSRYDLAHSPGYPQPYEGEKEPQDTPRKDYKPVPLRMWFLALTLTIVLSLLALTEIAVRLLPDGTKAAQPLYEVNATATNSARAIDAVSLHRERDEQYQKRWENTSASITSISSTPDNSHKLRICTTTVFLEPRPATTPEVLVTVTQPTVTVTVDLNNTNSETMTTTTTGSKSTKPTERISMSSSSSEASCDTTMTETITAALSFTRTTIEVTATNYVTIGLNTVTVTIGERQTIDGGTDGNGQTPTPPVGVVVPPVTPTPVPPDSPFTTVTQEDPPSKATEGGDSIPSGVTGPNTPGTLDGSNSFTAGDGRPFTVGPDIISGTGIENQPPPTPVTTMIALSTVGPNGAVVATTKESVYLVTTSTFLVASTGADGLVTTNTLASVYTVPGKATQNSAGGAAFITEVLQTMTDSSGSAVAISTRLAYGTALLTTLTDSSGRATATKTLDTLYDGHTTVFSGIDGRPTGTGTYFVIASISTLTDANGNSIEESTTIMTLTPGTSFITDSRGSTVSTATLLVSATFPTTSIPTITTNPPPGNTSNRDGNEKVLKVYAITQGEYFVGLILPTLLTTLLGIPIRIIHHHARLYQPFHALRTASHGATDSQSLLFATTEWSSSIALLKSGQFLLPMTELLVFFSALLVPMSAEAVQIIRK
jgi:hypothetical protein